MLQLISTLAKFCANILSVLIARKLVRGYVSELLIKRYPVLQVLRSQQTRSHTRVLKNCVLDARDWNS